MKQVTNLILIIIIGFIVYADALNNDFVYDDYGLVVNNRYIRDWNNLPEIFTTNLLAGSNNKSNFYRPIQTLTYLIDYSFFKLKPWGYHLTNTLIHLMNGILVFLLINAIAKNMVISTVTSLLFIIHPIQTESITYISGRADPLACLFMLLSLLLFIRYSILKRIPLYLASVFSFVLSLLSKEISIIFPLLLVLYDSAFLNKELKLTPAKRFYSRYLLYFIITIIYAFLRLTYLKFPVDETSPIVNIPLHLRLLTISKVIILYLGLLFLPFGLHMERAVEVSHSLFEPEVLFSVIFLFFILVFIVRGFKKFKLISFGLSWFFVTLLPVSNIMPLNAFMAEHWLYIPSIGFFIAIGFVVERLINKKIGILRNCIKTSFVSLLIFYSVLTIGRNLDWKDSITFYLKTLKYNPQSDRIYFNLGDAYRRQQQLDKAKECYQKAMEINPDYPGTYNNLGIIYYEEGNYEKAKELYQKTLETDPNYADAYNNLGLIYYQKDQLNEAIENIKIAIKINPDNSKFHNNLGSVYARKKLFKEARASWQKALEVDPDNPSPKENLKRLEKTGY